MKHKILRSCRRRGHRSYLVNNNDVMDVLQELNQKQLKENVFLNLSIEKYRGNIPGAAALVWIMEG